MYVCIYIYIYIYISQNIYMYIYRRKYTRSSFNSKRTLYDIYSNFKCNGNIIHINVNDYEGTHIM